MDTLHENINCLTVYADGLMVKLFTSEYDLFLHLCKILCLITS